MDGEIIIYDVDANYSYKRIKIGDGKTNVNQLPFLKDKALEDAIANKANSVHKHSDYDITVDVGKHHPWTGKLPSVLDEINEAIEGKTSVGHSHVIGDIKNLSQTIDSLQGSADSLRVDIDNIRNGSITVAEATHAATADSATDAHSAVNATNAAKASQLATARTISLTGDATGSVSFDGTQNVSLAVTVADDSHNHIISNIDGLQDALNSKSDSTHSHKLADLTADSTHRVVTDTQISNWNAKSNFSGSYTDLTNKPTLGPLAAKITIDKADLATDVQASLAKADTALQSVTKADVVDALGYEPLNTNTTYDLTATQRSGENVKLNLVAGGSGTGTDSVEIKSGNNISVYKDTVSGAIVIDSLAKDTDTTYTVATGDNNGQIKVTPKGGVAYNVNVKGLGTAAYTASTDYDAKGAANTALASAKAYTDTAIAAITDNNTTYELSQNGNIVILEGSDGEATSVQTVGRNVQGETLSDASGTQYLCGEGAEVFNYYNTSISTYADAPDDGGGEDFVSNIASGAYSHAEGYRTKALGDYSHAEGYNTIANDYSHAEGNFTTASGDRSHAEGYNTIASGHNSHAEGNWTNASGDSSHVEGSWTEASGDFSHAEGYHTAASSECQHVQGKYNIEDTQNKYAHIVGNGDVLAHSNAHTLDWDGNAEYQGDVIANACGGTNPISLVELHSTVADKADASHRHESADVTIDVAFKDDSVLGNAVTLSDALLAIDSEFNNKADVNHNHNNQYDAKGAASDALASAKTYADNKISDLINSAPTTLDTLGEIATAMEENADVVDALEDAIGNKSDRGHVHVADYTPSGHISPKFTGTSATSNATSDTTSIYSITNVGSLPTMTANVTNRCLTLSFNAGSVPTRSSVSVPSASHTHNVTATGNIQATFVGSPARI